MEISAPSIDPLRRPFRSSPDRLDRSFQTDARAEPAHPEVGTASGASGPWRTATLVASAVAGVELVILLALAIVFVVKPLSAHAKEAGMAHATGIAPAPKPGRPEPEQATLSRGETSVIVLNGNGVSGAAATAATRARARGYAIATTGNARRPYGHSVVMYRPGRRPEGQRLARDMGVRIVGPLDGMSVRQLLGAQVVLVLGS